MHHLLVLRHGKSDWPDGVDDFDRPLKKRGRRDSARMGLWLQSRDLAPDRVITSPAKRARGTARRVCDALGLGEGVIAEDAGLYHAGAETLVARVRACPEETGRILMVGHNPGLEAFVARFAGRPVRLPTCGLAVISCPGSWADLIAGGGRLDHLIVPRELAPA